MLVGILTRLVLLLYEMFDIVPRPIIFEHSECCCLCIEHWHFHTTTLENRVSMHFVIITISQPGFYFTEFY